MRWTLFCALAVAFAAILLADCTRQAHVSPPRRLTVYFCKPGTDALVPVHYSIDQNLKGAQLGNYALSQLLAGPGSSQKFVVLFPAATQARLTQVGSRAVVDLRGPLSRGGVPGASDEIALFKSLTYTLTDLPGVKEVQVLLDGKKAAALPGGHLELDEPLTRDTFTQ